MHNIFLQGMVLRISRILWMFGLKYLMQLFGRKPYILNTFNLWVFYMGLPLCYDVGDYPVFVTYDYPVFVTTSLWCVITHLCDNESGWRLPLCMIRVNPWVCGWGCCSQGQKTTCKRGTVWRVIPYYPWGEEVNSWVCGWG